MHRETVLRTQFKRFSIFQLLLIENADISKFETQTLREPQRQVENGRIPAEKVEKIEVENQSGE